jgi:arylsulfatase A-like enzyme
MNKLINNSLGLIAAGLSMVSCTQEPKQPNIIIFLSDDQGYGDFSITGNSNLQTPNIDRLAEEGVMFSHFYVCAACSPTRAEFLTGRYHIRSGVLSTSESGELFNLDETTIANLFKNAGYTTAAYGKWHNGTQYPYHPNGRGFDEFYGFSSGHWGNYFSPMLEHNGQIVRGEGYLPDDLTDKAIEFIENNKDNPFFVYIPYNTPHSPMQVQRAV